MAYTITLSNGSTLGTIADGSVNTALAPITLIGKNFAGYGTYLNQDLVRTIENFAHSSAPANALKGQLWWDSGNRILKYNASTNSTPVWKPVTGVVASGAEPASGVTAGDFWWDTDDEQLKVYSGSEWIVVGPDYTSVQGVTGAFAATIVDDGSVSHSVIKFFAGDVLTAIMSKDAEFTPNPAIVGFATIAPGFNLSTDIANNAYNGLFVGDFVGTATDSDALGGVAAANYLRSDTNDTTSGTLGVLNDSGVTIGTDSDLHVYMSGTTVKIDNDTAGGGFVLNLQTPGDVLTIDGSTGLATVKANPTAALGIATKAYVDAATGAGSVLDGNTDITGVINPNVDGTIDFGQSTKKFKTVWANVMNVITLKDDPDAGSPKGLTFSVSGITAGQTRTWTAPNANITVAGINHEQAWTAQQTPMNGTLSDGATINWDADVSGQVVAVTLAGNRTLAAPTNINEHASYVIRIVQDATGSRTLVWNAAYKFSEATAPTLTTSANAVDIFTFIGGAGNVLYCVGQVFDVR